LLSALTRALYSLKRHWPRHLGTLALVLLVVLGVQTWQTRHVPAEPLPDLPLALLGTNGQVVQTSLRQWRAQHGNRAVAVHVWAEWCPICRAEEGSVTALGEDCPVLTVAMQSGGAPAVSDVLAERGLDWTTAIDADGRIAQSYGLRGVPAFVIVGPAGEIRSAARTLVVGGCPDLSVVVFDNIS